MTSSAGSPARSANWNLPNAITVVRILLAPVFFWMLLADGGDDGWLRWAAAALFIVAISTDWVDGQIARSRGLVTDLGKILDPIADKLLTSGALVCLSILGELPWWVTVDHRRARGRHHGLAASSSCDRGNVVPASSGGKLKTRRAVGRDLVRARAALDGVRRLDPLGQRTALMTAAVVLTVWSGLLYVRDAVRLARSPRAGRTTAADVGERMPRADADLAATLIAELTRRGLRIAVAESLTGGLVLAELTSIPGASLAVNGGVVAYDTAVKRTLLGVSAELLAREGAVHPEVARQMATGAMRVLAVAGRPADVGVSTTGVAGPDPQDGKAPGIVFVAVAVGRGRRCDRARVARRPGGDPQRDRCGGARGDARTRVAELTGESPPARHQRSGIRYRCSGYRVHRPSQPERSTVVAWNRFREHPVTSGRFTRKPQCATLDLDATRVR